MTSQTHKQVVLIVMFAVVTIATSCTTVRETTLSGTWDVVRVSGSGVRYEPSPSSQPWIRLKPRFEGYTGCNRITSNGPPLVLEGERISGLSWKVEEKACEGSVARIEALMLEALGGENDVVIEFDDNRDLMRLVSPEGFVIELSRR